MRFSKSTSSGHTNEDDLQNANLPSRPRQAPHGLSKDPITPPESDDYTSSSISSSSLSSSPASNSDSDSVSASEPSGTVASTLRARLHDFIPRLAAANMHITPSARIEISTEEIPEQVLFKPDDDADDEQEPYIELDLGLGVLEHLQHDEGNDNAEAIEPMCDKRKLDDDDSDVLGMLMGKRRKLDQNAIQEVGRPQNSDVG